jgi:formylglycine-generating enzyme required for sulfatase activity
MGSNDFYPEERPVHHATVAGFWIETCPVTNAAFRRFVKATGYITVAECALNPADFPGADPAMLAPGALVFRNPGRPVSLHDVRQWWMYVPGASWRHPEGPGSTLDGRERHPVVQVAYEDALAYATWAGKALPTEAEWEFAARGGLAGAAYVWGDEFAPKGRMLANPWQGAVPWQNLKTDGYEGTSPVGAFPPNGFGLYDMAGNVWQWTCDVFGPHDSGSKSAPCCAPDLRGQAPRSQPGQPAAMPAMVIKGGSYLCAPNYCLRYRPAARQSQAIDTATSHIGFRCVVRLT